MKYMNQVFTAHEVSLFQNYWNTNWQDKSYVNWELDGQILDRRLELAKDSEVFAMVKQVVERYFDNALDVWSAYQRQNFAHAIHIDDYGIETDFPCYTMIFSMDTQPKFKTIVFKETAHNNQKLQQKTEQWAIDRLDNVPMQQLSNISDTEDLEHTYDKKVQDYFANYLHLDGIFSYQTGHGVLFDARQLHCTSNWLKYPEFTHRELLQVHIMSATPIAL